METGFSILIIDDEPNLRRSLSLILQEAGYQVATVADGTSALAALQNDEFDLVFLDLRLPDQDGITLLPSIHSQFPELPVLILTAHATLESAREAVRHGARDYLLKPVKPAQLLLRVGEILAEVERPRRRRDLVSQIQQLVTELHRVDLNAAIQNEARISPANTLVAGVLELNLLAKTVLKAGRAIHLPPATFDYLVALVRHSPNTVKYQDLVMEAQGFTSDPIEARELSRWHIHELRKGLETDPNTPQLILTVRNTGYRLVVENATQITGLPQS